MKESRESYDSYEDGEDSQIEEIRKQFHIRHLTTDERDRIIRLFNTEHPYRQTDSETDEKAVASREKHLLTPKQRDAFIDEYNAELLTPEERDRFVKEYNAEHSFRRIDTETNQNHHHREYRTSGLSESPELKARKRFGKLREVRVFLPHFGQNLQSPSEVIELIKNEYSGVQYRQDLDSLMKTVIDHFRLIYALDDREKISQGEVKEIAAKLDIRPRDAIRWAFYSHKPRLYEVLSRATSRSEAKQRVDGIRNGIDGIASWEDVQERLTEIYPLGEHETRSLFQSRKRNVVDFFRVLNEAEKGGTVAGIARRTGIPRNRASAIMNGHLPYLIRLILPSVERTSTMPTLTYDVKIKPPEIRGIRVETIPQLKKIIRGDSPLLFIRSDLPQLLNDAAIHLELCRDYREKDLISYGELTTLAQKSKKHRRTIHRWVCEGVIPKVHVLISRSWSREKIEQRLDEMRRRSNGITNMEELDKRFDNLYYSESYSLLGGYDANRSFAKRFFRFLETISVYMKNPETSVLPRWAVNMLYQGTVAKYVRIGASIPAEFPMQGMKWLPRIHTERKKWDDFIEVPLVVTSSKDILGVLNQIPSLNTLEIKTYEQQFGEMPKHLALMYLLGIIVSDGHFGTKMMISTRVLLSASKTYSFCDELGSAFCYALGKLGIEGWWDRDEVIPTGEMRKWMSAKSPLFVWMRQTLLGFKTSSTKSTIALEADWILDTPYDWRVAFLQGLADGDGWASIKNQYAGIATKVNQDFVQRLFTSLGIEANNYSGMVQIHKKKALEAVQQLSLFRHARERQERLADLVDMLDSMKICHMTEREKELILDLHDQGLGTGEIVETLWKEHQVARRPGAIRALLKRTNEGEDKQSEQN